MFSVAELHVIVLLNRSPVCKKKKKLPTDPDFEKGVTGNTFFFRP